MTAGMAEVIAAHSGYGFYPRGNDDVWYVECDDCDWRQQLTYGEADHAAHAAHVAKELAKAGYGNAREALRTTADEMQAERETWCLDESGRHWIKRTLDDLRQRAATMEAPHGVD